MKRWSTSQFVCPACGGEDLKFDPDTGNDDVETGQLTCNRCNASYQIVDGIPRFVPASNYADSFGFQWNTHALTQLDSACKTTISKDRVFGVTQWPADMTGQTILEAGSGAGRFTEVLVTTGAEVYSFDFSSAVDANKRSNGSNSNLVLFQGDIFNIPVKDASMDNVFCLGVIQHTPDPYAAFKSLAGKVKPGGRLAIDVYADTLAARLQWKYFLRPLTKNMDGSTLYRAISAIVPVLLPITKLARKIAGRAGARLSPIVEYSYLGLKPEVNKQWAILDTFDMYSPAHDHPQTIEAVRRWFAEIEFEDVEVARGPNGIIGRGRRPVR